MDDENGTPRGPIVTVDVDKTLAPKPGPSVLDRTAFDLFADVGDFHAKFGLYVGSVPGRHLPSTAPHLLPESVEEFRVNFMQEELSEYQDACEALDLAKAADALVDLVYVALGTAHLMGLSFNRHWHVVHAANLAKERATGADDPRSTRGHSLDVVKPAGWVAPEHGPILELTAAEYRYVHETTDPA